MKNEDFWTFLGILWTVLEIFWEKGYLEEFLGAFWTDFLGKILCKTICTIFLDPKNQSFLVFLVVFPLTKKTCLFHTKKSYYLELFNLFFLKKLFLLEKTIFEYRKSYILHDFRACNVLVTISWCLLPLALFPFCRFLSCCVKKCLTGTTRRTW